jgi:hypothetical protein
MQHQRFAMLDFQTIKPPLKRAGVLIVEGRLCLVVGLPPFLGFLSVPSLVGYFVADAVDCQPSGEALQPGSD